MADCSRKNQYRAEECRLEGIISCAMELPFALEMDADIDAALKNRRIKKISLAGQPPPPLSHQRDRMFTKFIHS